MADYDPRRDVDRDPTRSTTPSDPFRDSATTTAYRDTGGGYDNPPPQHHHVGVGSKNVLDWLALVLLIVGGLNWGLVGLFGFDLVSAIFGSGTAISRAIYVAVGVAAIWGFALMRLGPAPRH